MTPPERRRAAKRRSPLFPVVRASAFTRRHTIDDTEMARSAIAPWEEVAPLPLVTPPTWRARGYRLDAEGAPRARGRRPPGPGDAGTNSSNAGAREEETSGVGLNARLVLATDEATAADSISDGRRENERARLRRRRRRRARAGCEARVGNRASASRAFSPEVSSFATPGPSATASSTRSSRPPTATTSSPRPRDERRRRGRAGIAPSRASGDSRRARTPRRSRRASSRGAARRVGGRVDVRPDPRDTAEGGARETPAAAPAPTLGPSPRRWRGRSAYVRGDDAGTSGAANPKHSPSRETPRVPSGVAARALVERELDAAAVSEREARMRRLETRAAEIDAAVADPRTRGAKGKVGFQRKTRNSVFVCSKSLNIATVRIRRLASLDYVRALGRRTIGAFFLATITPPPRSRVGPGRLPWRTPGPSPPCAPWTARGRSRTPGGTRRGRWAGARTPPARRPCPRGTRPGP